MDRQFAGAVIGATGLIGETLITVLEERGFPVAQLYALASNRSLGRSVSFRGRSHPVQELSDFDFAHCDLALFCAGAQVSREYAPKAVAAGCLVIEDRKSTRLNSSHSQISYAVFCLKKKNMLMIAEHSYSYITQNFVCPLTMKRTR